MTGSSAALGKSALRQSRAPTDRATSSSMRRLSARLSPRHMTRAPHSGCWAEKLTPLQVPIATTLSGHSRGHETSGADAPHLPFANTVRIGSVGYAHDGHSERPTSRRYGVALKTAMPLPAEFGSKIKLWLALAVKAATEWPQQPGWLRTWIALPGLLLTTPNFPPGVLTYQALEPGSNQISSAPPIPAFVPRMVTLPLLASINATPLSHAPRSSSELLIARPLGPPSQPGTSMVRRRTSFPGFGLKTSARPTVVPWGSAR